MKTLKLSALAACFLLFVSSCTKDDSSLSTSRTTSTQESIYGASGTGKPDENGGKGNTGDVSAAGDNDNQPQDLKSISIVVTPNPVNQGNSYTVTGTMEFPFEISTGKVVLERGFKYDANGVKVYTSLAEATNWDQLKSEDIKTAVTTYSISTTGTANEAPGFYGFRLHFIPVGGAKVKNGFAEVNMEVVRVCDVNALTITGEATAVPYKNVQGVEVPGVYEFTIKFTLKSPEAMTGIKFQGGATSGGKFKHDITDLGDMKVVNDNLQNTVLMWKGSSLEACDGETISFKYKREFKCSDTPVDVTGDWTATVNGAEVHPPVTVTFKCN